MGNCHCSVRAENAHFPLALLPRPAYLLPTTSPNPACTEGGSGGTNYRGEAPCARGNLFGPSPSANLAGVEGRRSPVHRSALHICRSVACRGPVHRLCPPALAWWRILRAPIPSGLWSGTPFDPIPGRAATLPGPSRAPCRASSATESPAMRGFRFPRQGGCCTGRSRVGRVTQTERTPRKSAAMALSRPGVGHCTLDMPCPSS